MSCQFEELFVLTDTLAAKAESLALAQTHSAGAPNRGFELRKLLPDCYSLKVPTEPVS